ncbi:hypothetical protein ASG29_00105 [Sphingomonas sp. Leaf412]|uniref:acyltransferase family protein n=1 Tax=Sphingomonas sp. Leaf412 TaxID=1736370 RepID=UPI0006F57997|nr:acyltransferase [Sphingomonas sp. Leaf412]KQT34620.1 hypothetical protein ASG29_00105 [Sphingomonas sp. Leaf412]
MVVDDRSLTPAHNNLTLVRLVLASAVIWTHSVWRMSGRQGADEFAAILGAPISQFAVDGFFFLSGMLVYSSLVRRGSARDFATARIARLWPALAVSVLATVAAGGFLTQAPGLSYLSGDTAKFLVGNLTLTSGHYTLTGVRCGAAPCNVNGSLWTITWEARCYLLLIVLFLTGLSSPRLMKRVVLPATLAFAILMDVPQVQDMIARVAGKGVLYNLVMVDRLWTMFALGIAAHLWRDRIRLSWIVLAVLLGLVVLSAWVMPVPHLGGVFVAYAVLCFGFLSARGGAVSGDWPDYSYGMYIYAFPIMMAVAALVPVTHHWQLALLNLLLTLPLAALSWHFVEKPVLDLVRDRRKARG